MMESKIRFVRESKSGIKIEDIKEKSGLTNRMPSPVG